MLFYRLEAMTEKARFLDTPPRWQYVIEGTWSAPTLPKLTRWTEGFEDRQTLEYLGPTLFGGNQQPELHQKLNCQLV